MKSNRSFLRWSKADAIFVRKVTAIMFVPRIVSVHALVLKVSPFREKDRLLTLLTRGRGKVLALAQGCQIPQNRLAPVTQTGVIANFWLAKAREFDRVTDYRIERFLRRLRGDVLALCAFCVMAELLELAVPLETPDEELFNEVLWFTGQLERGVEIVKWLTAVQIRLLWRMGWMPYLLSCALCGSAIEAEKVPFAASLGGSLCVNCWSKSSPWDVQIFPNTVLQSVYSLWHQPRLMETLHMRGSLWNQALSLLRSYWRYHLEIEPKSWRVWERLTLLALRPRTSIPNPS